MPKLYKPLILNPHLFCVAPMMDWTDVHERTFLRLITRHALLYTEMVTTGAVLHGDRQRLIGFGDAEHPVALQLGGAEPASLAEAARIGEDFGYDEINLNSGCPSDRVQSGRFGACLMAEPDLVADCVAAMRAATALPVTVKCRIGIDDQDPEETFLGFVDRVASAGCTTFIVHARKAWLKGLSPKENRDVPPLDYGLVYRLKRERPALQIIINGGIASLDDAEGHLSYLDGVMLGRTAYQSPYVLADVDRRFFGDARPQLSRHEILESFLTYMEEQCARGVPLYAMARHLLGLFQGMPGARAWRRHISENGHKQGAGIQVIRDAAAMVSQNDSSAAA